MATVKIKSKNAKAKTTKAKAAPKTAKAKAVTSPGRPRIKSEESIAKIVSLRDEDGKSWDDIAAAMDANTSTVRTLYTWGTVAKRDRIDKLDDEAAGVEIARLRDEENVAWYVIAARHQSSQPVVKRLYTEATGNEANQGHSVVSRRAALKAETTKASKADANAAKAKAKKATTKARTKAKGSPNPSKG